MSVVDLNAYRNQDTVAVLKHLLNQAVVGNITGVAMCFTDRDGAEHSFLAGAMQEQPPCASGSCASRLQLVQPPTPLRDQKRR